MAFLRVISGLYFDRRYHLPPGNCRLGRDASCEISTIFQYDRNVDDFHAVVTGLGGQFQIAAVSDRAKTYLNGHRLSGVLPLSDGDTLRIGTIELVFCTESPEIDAADVGEAFAERTRFVDDGDTTRIRELVDAVTTEQHPAAGARYHALLQMLQTVHAALALDQVHDSILSALFQIFPAAQRGFIGFVDLRTNGVIPSAVKMRHTAEPEPVRVSRTIVARVLQEKKAILSTDAVAEAAPQGDGSVRSLGIRSVMCAPLLDAEGNGAGVIQLDSPDACRFQPDDLDLLNCIAPLAAFTLEFWRVHQQAVRDQKLIQDVRMARAVQEKLLPRGRPSVPGYAFFDYFEPARILGGDLFAYVRLPDHRLAAAVADVSGKGIPAALYAARLSSDLFQVLVTEPTCAAALSRLNEHVCGDAEPQLVSCILTIIDFTSHVATIANAGHMDPILRSADGQVRRIGTDVRGLLLGVAEGVRYDQYEQTLRPGDTVVMYTDGFSDARNPQDEMYSDVRILSRVHAGISDPRLLGRNIVDDVITFMATREQADDMCLLCFGRQDGQ